MSDFKTMQQRLGHLGLTEHQVNGVVDILLEGLSVNLVANNIQMHTADVSLISNKQPGFPLTVNEIDVNIAGINPHQIKSVQFPKISYVDTHVFEMVVELLPLSFALETEQMLTKMQEGLRHGKTIGCKGAIGINDSALSKSHPPRGVGHVVNIPSLQSDSSNTNSHDLKITARGMGLLYNHFDDLGFLSTGDAKTHADVVSYTEAPANYYKNGGVSMRIVGSAEAPKGFRQVTDFSMFQISAVEFPEKGCEVGSTVTFPAEALSERLIPANGKSNA